MPLDLTHVKELAFFIDSPNVVPPSQSCPSCHFMSNRLSCSRGYSNVGCVEDVLGEHKTPLLERHFPRAHASLTKQKPPSSLLAGSMAGNLVVSLLHVRQLHQLCIFIQPAPVGEDFQGLASSVHLPLLCFLQPKQALSGKHLGMFLRRCFRGPVVVSWRSGVAATATTV